MKCTPRALTALWLASLGVPCLGLIGVLVALNTSPLAISFLALLVMSVTIAQFMVLMCSVSLSKQDPYDRMHRVGLLWFNLLATLLYPTLVVISVWINFQAMSGINSGV
ncbi:MAG: hypothetical protein AAGA55_00030 [Planctomycetota bacterium]